MDNQNQPKIIRHIQRWKLLYEFFGVIGVVLAVIVSLVGIYISYLSTLESGKAVAIAKNSLDLTKESVSLQKKEFQLRNRPFIIVSRATLHDKKFKTTETVNNTGDKIVVDIKKSIELKIDNISDIPATNTNAKLVSLLDGKEVLVTNCSVDGLGRDNNLACNIDIREEVLEIIEKNSSQFYVTYDITYSGMLGESPEEYRTTGELYLKPEQDTVSIRDTTFK